MRARLVLVDKNGYVQRVFFWGAGVGKSAVMVIAGYSGC